MEDILALIVVLVGISGVVVIGRIVYNSYKERKRKQQEEKQRLQKRLDDIQGINMTDRWNKVTPQQYADAMPKRKPAMKKANVGSSYANTPMTTTSSTSTAGSLDIGDVVTGALVLNELFGHKSEASTPSRCESSSSWGLDDSDSRKSISDSMSSSWSSSDSSSSSDSGPSSDW